MSDRFLRKYKITIGKPERKKIVQELVDPSTLFMNPTITQNPTGEPYPGVILNKEVITPSKAFSFDDLHFKATIHLKKSAKASSADPVIIEVYNLADAITSSNLKDNLIVVEAGYETDGELPLVFFGSIIDHSTTRSGQDTITKLLCADDTGVKRGGFASFRFTPKTSYYNMITTVLESLASSGLPHAPIREVDFGIAAREVEVPGTFSEKGVEAIGLKSTFTETGVSYEGNTVDILDSICQEVDFRAYIVHNVIYVEPKSNPLVNKVIEIEQDSIKGDIYLVSRGTGELTGKGKSGLKFTMFLDGRVDPATKIKINFGRRKGTYFITSLKHQLEFEGNNWTTEVICTFV